MTEEGIKFEVYRAVNNSELIKAVGLLEEIRRKLEKYRDFDISDIPYMFNMKIEVISEIMPKLLEIDRMIKSWIGGENEDNM